MRSTLANAAAIASTSSWDIPTNPSRVPTQKVGTPGAAKRRKKRKMQKLARKKSR